MNGQDEITNAQDIIDSRDIIARIEYLEAELDEAHADDQADEVLDMRAELANLKRVADQASGYASDWQYGETLIRDSYFEEYARQLAEDIGAIPDDAKWPCNCIDWEQAARELQTNYTSVDFDGVTYWVR